MRDVLDQGVCALDGACRTLQSTISPLSLLVGWGWLAVYARWFPIPHVSSCGTFWLIPCGLNGGGIPLVTSVRRVMLRGTDNRLTLLGGVW